MKSQTSAPSNWKRKILHIDMDAFFASVEQRDNPKLRGKPVIVGGKPDGRGVVSTASYEARMFGIRSAMPAAQAKRLCYHAIFIRPNFEKYKAASDMIHSIFENYATVIESASLDEAYLDITKNKLNIEDPVLLAQMIQQNIYAVTKLTASAGVATNKFLAKIASDIKKPAGLTVVPPEHAESFLRFLPVIKIPGIGPVTEKEIHKHGIKTVGELARLSKSEFCDLFGSWGESIYDRVHGIDDSPVEPAGESKQISSEETFENDIIQFPPMEEKITELSEVIVKELEERNIKARTITLKVKYADFTSITRSRTLSMPTDSTATIQQEAVRLLHEKTEAGKRLIRLLGVGVSNLVTAEEQITARPRELELFDL
ncbi:DNA polymerase IV [bacterium]|nr:DNA polymerase IV [bacterium]